MMSSMRGVTKRIASIKFALLSPDEIRRMSATKIITADTYDDGGFTIDMGLMDSHLGVIEPRLRCKTCGGKVGDSPGHMGPHLPPVAVEPVALQGGDELRPQAAGPRIRLNELTGQ